MSGWPAETGSQMRFRISITQYLDTSVEIAGIDLSVSTCNGLENSIILTHTNYSRIALH